ncbi:MAG TPA: hypothetical protein VKP14_05810 [Gaiellaceae bacterium]|nr:hypothetical protein [Gaiellaceae bacterium]
MSEKDALRDEVRQEREQLVASVRRLRSEVASVRRKLPFVAGLGLVVAVAKAIRRMR